MCWLWLGLKARALAWPDMALAHVKIRPGQNPWLWPGSGLALAWAICGKGCAGYLAVTGSVSFQHPIECVMLPVLDLDPVL